MKHIFMTCSLCGSTNADEAVACASCGASLSRDEDLADNLVRLLTDENRRNYFREAGLQRAQDFRWDRVCAQYEAVYRADNPRAL